MAALRTQAVLRWLLVAGGTALPGCSTSIPDAGCTSSNACSAGSASGTAASAGSDASATTEGGGPPSGTTGGAGGEAADSDAAVSTSGGQSSDAGGAQPDCSAAAAPSGDCRSDDDCPAGFCDRTGRCETVDQSSGFGAPCSLARRVADGLADGMQNGCGAYLCLAGRCRSCVKDEECQVEYGAPTCRQLSSRPGNRCGDYSQATSADPAMAAGSAGSGLECAGATPRRLTVHIINSYPHATDAHTQGLVYADSALYESTGIAGNSQLRKTALADGTILQAEDLPEDVFGEGLAIQGDRLVQLSLDAGRAFEWDRGSLALRNEHSYSGKGWGLCHDGKRFVMSDGTDVLQLRDTETFEPLDTVQVTLPGMSLQAGLRLNELECVGSDVFANVLEYREIVQISMLDGTVTAWIDTRHLLRDVEQAPGDPPATLIEDGYSLNGIAHKADSGSFLLTGKNWPRVFEVEWVADDLFQ